MKLKEKVISILKIIGIALLGVLTLFLGSGLRNMFKGKNNNEEAKKSVDTIKDTLAETQDTLKESSHTLQDMKDTITGAQEAKENLAATSTQSRQEAAEQAGFKKII
jgi:signal transduction histidine kinase